LRPIESNKIQGFDCFGTDRRCAREAGRGSARGGRRHPITNGQYHWHGGRFSSFGECYNHQAREVAPCNRSLRRYPCSPDRLCVTHKARSASCRAGFCISGGRPDLILCKLFADTQDGIAYFAPYQSVCPIRTVRSSLPTLTSLRFFAATAVVAFHAGTGSLGDVLPIDGFLKRLAAGGYTAVTFFFILSGFIMVYAHAGRREVDRPDVRASTFWRLRAARILPAYLFALAIGLPSLIHEESPTWQGIIGPVLVLFLLQAWWPPVVFMWNFPAWSLSVEAAFYALFPWLSSASARLPRQWLFVIAYALILVSSVWRAATPVANDISLQPLPPFHLPVFIFGMALGRQFLFGPALSPKVHGAMFCLGVVAAIAILGSPTPAWTKTDAVLAVVFSLIIFGAARPPAALTLLAHPVLVLLGEASYSIFILHVPLRLWWSALELGLSPWPDYLLFFAALVGFSILSFRCVETPMRKLIAQLG
jgi:peptidoglycan/LPS O-acetylase OafA/YrhL